MLQGSSQITDEMLVPERPMDHVIFGRPELRRSNSSTFGFVQLLQKSFFIEMTLPQEVEDDGLKRLCGHGSILSYWRLIMSLVQELDGALPGQASGPGVILRAILLEEPVLSPWIGIEGGLLARGLERLLHLRDRLRRLEGIILREMAEIGGLCAAIVRSGIGGIKDHDGSDLFSQIDRRVQRVGPSQREADEGELAVTPRLVCCIPLAQELYRPRDVTAHPLLLLIQRRGQRFRFLDRRGCLALIEVGSERHETRLRESVTDLSKWLRQPPPGMQDHHTRPAAMLGNGQITASCSTIHLKFHHATLLKYTDKTLYLKQYSTDVLYRISRRSSCAVTAQVRRGLAKREQSE